MQFLIQELNGKISKFFNYMGWTPIKILVRLIFYGAIIAGFGWIIYTKKYIWLFIIFGAWLIAEIAHYLRKSRETKANEVLEKKNLSKKLKEPAKNKDLLTGK